MAAARDKLGAVLLAAGASRRFGTENKLLAEVEGVPLVVRTAETLAASGVSTLVVVTGAAHDATVDVLAGMDVTIVRNPNWDEGMGGSIAIGIRALHGDIAGVFIVPGDMPNLSTHVLRKLADTFAADEGRRVIVPVTADGAQRNPVLWPRGHFPSLATLAGDKGGKPLLAALGEDARRDVVFDDASLFIDIDTQEDLARLRAEGTR